MDMPLPPTAERPRLQRAEGEGRLWVEGRESRLTRLYQSGSAKIRFSRPEGAGREAVLINTSGGLTGGDRLSWGASVGADARCQVVTQACEKVYRSVDGPAVIRTDLSVGAGGHLEWLPQETILFNGADLDRRFDVTIEPGGRFLAVEGVLLGRAAMGETRIRALLRDRWRVQWGKRLIFADDLRFDIRPSTVGRAAILREARAFALVLLVAEDAPAHLEAVRAHAGPHGGASAWDGKLVCRLAEADGLALRRRLLDVMSALRNGAPPPRLWMV
jgi:urease accessory protein